MPRTRPVHIFIDGIVGFLSEGKAHEALRRLNERRGVQLKNADYDARVARHMRDGSPQGFYIEVYAKHPHRHIAENEHRAEALVKEYRALYPDLAIELKKR